MNSFIEENYLKTLFNLSNEKGEVNVNELSKKLEIKMPTVTSMMKKLSEKGLVHYESYKPIRLSDKGKKAAALIIRKHRLTEMFLVEKMGFGWEEVHAIAEQIEHIKSIAFFEKMDHLLGFPKLDPHGSPIPNSNGEIESNHFKKLSECKVGDQVVLAAVINTSTDFLKFLNSRSLSLGTPLIIRSIESFDNSMVVSYADRLEETLSHTVCDRLLIE
jgi:DtxR family Mn-dependent transcriptional regulator